MTVGNTTQQLNKQSVHGDRCLVVMVECDRFVLQFNFIPYPKYRVPSRAGWGGDRFGREP